MNHFVSGIALTSILVMPLFGCSGGGSLASSSPIKIELPSPNQTRNYTIGIAGTRGSIPLSFLGVSNVIAPGGSIAAKSKISATSLLSVPEVYGDRRFVGWEYRGTRFSTSAAISELPATLNVGETITAVYEPIEARTSPLVPNYNHDDYYYWKSPDQARLKIYFDTTVNGDFKPILQEGFDRWFNALGSSFGYTLVTDQAEAQIVVKMGPVVGSVAQTSIIATNTIPASLVSASIILDPAQLPPIQSNRGVIVALAAHEFGHALGISGGSTQGHSDDAADTMFPIVTVNTIHITPRDINTLTNMYNDVFSSRHKPVTHRAASGLLHSKTIDCPVNIATK
ncbi:MAG: matrixin family metalloprotease [Armatimonadetes bacterium]|nr:matrixin family metalloprotease [Armatimonadota bacterium]